MWTRNLHYLAAICISVLTLLLPHRGRAQSFPMPPIDERLYREPWTIQSRAVEASIRHQVATVTVTDEIYNPQANEIETEYLFPLPPRALVDHFTLVMDGQELCGTIMDAKEARQLYEEIVRARRDPGLLEYADCGLFRSSAFPLGPHKTASITIQFSMICPADGNRVEFWYPLNSGRGQSAIIEDFSLRCNIESDAAITTVYSPTDELAIDRRSNTHVIATYENQRYLPPGEFQLFYETSSEQVGVSLFTYWPNSREDGYYMLMVNPTLPESGAETLAKNLIIVLDRSGSMAGEKIDQARAAVRFLIDHLNPRDRFNIIIYNDGVESCFEAPVAATTAQISSAHDYAGRITAAGGTNIHAALETALDHCRADGPTSESPNYIIFLTDGLPTAGITAEDAILADTRRANRAHVKLFAFGVGYDVNVRLLDKLVQENHGRSVFVRPNESIEAKVSSLYNRVRSPVMTDLKIDIEGFATRDNCPAELGDLFQDDQLIRAGRIYRRFGGVSAALFGTTETARLTLTGTVNGARRTLSYTVPTSNQEHSGSNRFVEKVWAVRRVGFLLDEIQVHGRSVEFVDELIALSKKYGIVTPYTSFLADEHRNLSDAGELRREALPELQASEERISGLQAHMDATTRQRLEAMSAPEPASKSGFAKQIGASDQVAYESDKAEVINTIRSVAGETLYKRGDAWVTADAVDLDLTRDRDQIKTVKRFSDEYFRLQTDADEVQNKIIAAQSESEKLLIRIDGQAYLIE